MSEYCKNCETLKEEIKQAFEEKDKLNVIIDRLLFASGYDTTTASAEDFEDVYENMSYKQNKFDEYKQALEEIEGIVNKKTEIPICDECAYRNIPECKENCMQDVLGEILDIIRKAKGEE